MTKARDIASAIPAPSTVDAAELGYLDGVTSAIQTQLDAKTAKATLTTTGDIYYASAANTPARLAIGSTSNVLTVAGGIPSWAAPAGGGKVLQVVQDLLDGLIQTTSTTYADTGLSVSITPSSASSKVLVMAAMQGLTKTSGNSQTKAKVRLLKDSTVLQNTGERVAYTNNDGTLDVGSHTIMYLDSPATTSSLTYKIQYASGTSGQTVYINDYEATDNNRSSIIVMEIGA